MPAPSLIFTRRDWLIALLVILLAFGYRMVIIMDRAVAPNALSKFDPLSPGGDQHTYYNQFLGFADGSYPPETFFYQPGLPYYLLFASSVLRTANLGALRVFGAALAAINCGLMIAVGRLVTGRRVVGILSGLLLAIYPISAFYDTDFVITSQALILTTLALFGTLWLWRSPKNWTGAVLLGLSIGAATVTRLEVVALAPVCGLWLIALRRDRRRAVLQVVLAAVIALAVLAPTVIHNRRGGANYLITPVGPAEIYRGNNRDAPGVYGLSNASESTHFDYFQYLAKDIALEPGRFVQLFVHKLALFLSNAEPGNNLSYFDSGQQLSPALALNPLNFSLLLAFTLYGLVMLIRDGHRAAAALLIFTFAGFMLMVLLIWVEARLRTPVIVMMIPAAAYGLVRLIETLRDRPPDDLRATIVTLVATGALLLVILLGVDDLPHKVTVAELPADAVAMHVVYDGVLELIGWRTETQYSPQNVIEPFRPYVVSLYWQLLEPTPVDYSFSYKFLVDGDQVMGLDQPIGSVVYPYQGTSQLETGLIYVEHVSDSYKHFDGPVEATGSLELLVYPERDFSHLLPAVAADGTSHDTVQLGQPAIRFGDGRSQFAEDAASVQFGGVLTLRNWQVPQTGTAREAATITTAWRTTQQSMTVSYAIGLYLFKDGDFIVNVDGPPHDGELLTLSIPTQYLFDDVKSLPLPGEPGVYDLRLGVYDQGTGERLPLADGIDNLYPLGQITVR